MPPPQAILCDLCGQKFFKRSLPIHRKQCEKKYAAAFTECKKCLRKVSNDEYEKHASECKVVRTQRVAKPKVQKERPIGGSGKQNPHDQAKAGEQGQKKKREKEPDSGSESESESSSDEEDYREQCGFCERKFNPDRIAKHEQICATNAERKSRKQFKSASQTRLEGTDFEKYMDPKMRREVEKPSTRWRSDHERLQGIVEQGRLVTAFKDAGIPLSELPRQGTDLNDLLQGDGSGRPGYSKPEDAPVPEGMKRCQHCKRSFRLETAEKHIPKCKNTVNKPKMLVRKSKPVLDKPKQDHSEVIKEAIRRVLRMKNKKDDFFETKEASMFHDGEIAYTEDGRRGTVRYVGRVGELYPGYWIGLELDEIKGHNDGSVEGARYFKCETGKGLFLRPSKLTKNPPLAKVHAVEGVEAPDAKKQTKAPAASSSKASQQDSQPTAPCTPETDETEPVAPKLKLKPTSKPGLVEKLREEVRKNSPRPTNQDDDEKPQKGKKKTSPRRQTSRGAERSQGSKQEQAQDKKVSPRANEKKKSTHGGVMQKAKSTENKRASAAEAARQKRLAKDVEMLEALHGKMAKGERGIGSREEIGSGRRLGGASSTAAKQVKKPTAASTGGGEAQRPDREARAAYFEKMFAQKNQQTAQ
ncbi:Zinc finger C2HC domain-containing protein 1C [Hondaea fermentalgiana]|uniref:Zinc finger C2HC domain-containing protein 1C n=1 Tax=Hondaea fermentalgiana TaxID=2315210 RepID=A0A2R5GDH1_9STRA|nr:Zinc finger C2HC domain-containing protein 1C [Hondaea fermentalgiana]|eukprot:GBG25854.1 Zinc finger C2HC domain-containing protein 1C [Hondaea fermentalgiana]